MDYYFVRVGYSYTPKNKAEDAAHSLIKSFDHIVISKPDVQNLASFWIKKISEINRKFKACGDVKASCDALRAAFDYGDHFTVTFDLISQAPASTEANQPLEFPKQCISQLTLW